MHTHVVDVHESERRQVIASRLQSVSVCLSVHVTVKIPVIMA